MNNQQRREDLLHLLRAESKPITASALADRYSVTRQVIVADIAILRASGHQILSSRKGYTMQTGATGLIRSILCRHQVNRMLEELTCVVDQGGTVLDVTVEHPLYGEITGTLNIASRYDAREFVQRLTEENATQLCDLTGGIHVHAIRVPNEDAYHRIEQALEEAGILVRPEFE